MRVRQISPESFDSLGSIAIFEGGGVKGIALAGAAGASLDAGMVFESTLGTSAGALVASLLAVGYSSHDLRNAVGSVDWPAMVDRRPIARLPLIGTHIAMALFRGAARGAALEREMSRRLASRGVKTFGDLPSGSLRIVSTDITHGTVSSSPTTSTATASTR